MKKLIISKAMISIIITVMLVSLIVTTFAYSINKTLDYTGIIIKFNGRILIPKDINGNLVNPFIIDGTTYLPIRAIAFTLGCTVEWVSETKTILLTSGKRPEYWLPDSYYIDIDNKGNWLIRATCTSDATIEYQDIKILLDGKTLTLTDANGDRVYPFIIDGTTYLPLRAIANALELNVEWLEESRTILLTTDDYVYPETTIETTTSISTIIRTWPLP